MHMGQVAVRARPAAAAQHRPDRGKAQFEPLGKLRLIPGALLLLLGIRLVRKVQRRAVTLIQQRGFVVGPRGAQLAFVVTEVRARSVSHGDAGIPQIRTGIPPNSTERAWRRWLPLGQARFTPCPAPDTAAVATTAAAAAAAAAAQFLLLLLLFLQLRSRPTSPVSAPATLLRRTIPTPLFSPFLRLFRHPPLSCSPCQCTPHFRHLRLLPCSL